MTSIDSQERRPDLLADREKRGVALSSILAAIFLTSMKIVVGLLTGSLGILSEAAHSGLDLVAAAVTFFAVRVSAQPPDQAHNYGHGKVENLSALFETLLLLLTCIWIIYEAVQRLFFKGVEVEVSIWAFVVMIVSILVDFTRSRALSRVAKKYESQALEADALHFSTDIWSSTVVIAGLALVQLSNWTNQEWLAKADAIAALGVAGIVVYVSLQLGKKTIADLLDSIPPGIRAEVTDTVLHVPGVLEIEKVRIRRSGPEFFADIAVTVKREAAFERAHEIATRVEASVRRVLPRADVSVSVTPAMMDNESMLATVRRLASRYDLGAHGIRVYDVMGNRTIEMHLEVNEHLSLDQAHAQVTLFEQELDTVLPGFNHILTHLEPIGDETATRQASPTPEGEQYVLRVLRNIVDDTGVNCKFYNINVRHVSEEIVLSFDCELDPHMGIVDAHELTERIEQLLRARVPKIGRVLIHVEPALPDRNHNYN